MEHRPLQPITPAEARRREERVTAIGRRFGFVGRIEYRHVRAGTGGAQYGMAASAEQDLLIVDARAFERDADTEDFSLEAIIAHERGHQIVNRSPYFRKTVSRGLTVVSQEAFASLAGSTVCDNPVDAKALFFKAAHDLCGAGMTTDEALPMLRRIRQLMREAL